MLARLALTAFFIGAPFPAAVASSSVDAVVASPAQVAQWLKEFRRDALAAGVSPAVFDRAFSGFVPDPKVVAADRRQPEFSKPFGVYMAGAVSSRRIAQGRKHLVSWSALLGELEKRYGVERHALTAIWGLESNYGAQTGGFNSVHALATLALGTRRAKFARGQLLVLLQLMSADPGLVKRATGSWAGAMGQVQFIPTSYKAHAVDHDGDGRRDIWSSVPDALASAANYLLQSGWKAGERWGYEVRLPDRFDYGLSNSKHLRSPAFWRARGVVSAASGLPITDAMEARLVAPEGHGGPAFLVGRNFNAILRYNASHAYAIAIGHLADRLNGAKPLKTAWRIKAGDILDRGEIERLQRLLKAMGFAPGKDDGLLGARTRRAVRAFQQQANLTPADGYPTRALLARIEKAHARSGSAN